MANVAIPIVIPVTLIFLKSPPILAMSCSPFMAWITDPAPRKRSALKKA